MKVSLVIFGIPRATDVTLEPFNCNVLRPAEKAGEVSLLGHLYEQKSVENSRSGESAALDPANYAPFKERFNLLLEAPGAAFKEPRWSQLKQAGDFYEDDYKSLANLLHQLHSIKQAYQLAMETVSPDVVIFARPDLLYHDAIPVDIIERAARNPNQCYLPTWQWWGGFNDRMAVCGHLAARAWSQRLDAALRYCRVTGHPVHAEKLLRFALTEAGVAMRTLPVKASRIRVGGVVREEIFDPMKSYSSRSGLIRMAGASILTAIGL